MSQPAQWQKSSFSGVNGEGSCIELAATHGQLKLREGDHPDDILTVTPHALNSLILSLKSTAPEN